MSALFVFSSILAIAVPPYAAEMLETCTGEDFSASCGSQDIILVNSAEYGRRAMGRCIPNEEPHMGCTTDVLPLLDVWCSGRRNCAFDVANPELEEENKNSENACPVYLKMYLKIDYSCLSVETRCENGGDDLHKEEGFLSSHVADQTGCGSSRSPWKISVAQGRTINLTLFEFSSDNTALAHNYMSCKFVYGYIIERSLGINQTICGGQGRERALYSSKTNSVELHFNVRRNSGDAHILIKYFAHGCPELRRSQNTWYKRQGNEAVIGCETNDQEWRLTCTGNTWQGRVGNCSQHHEQVAADTESNDQAPSGDIEVGFNSMIIMTGIACGVFVAVVVAVMCGVIYLKKYRMKHETKRIETTYATMEKQPHSYYRPVNDNSSNSNPPATDAPSERLVDVPGTWMQSDTFGRQGTMSSYQDQCMCPTLPGARC